VPSQGGNPPRDWQSAVGWGDTPDSIFCPYLKIFVGVEEDIIYQNMYSKSVKIAYFRRLRLAKKQQKLVYFTSNANKMTLNQIFFFSLIFRQFICSSR
jgi:hypothetical protein